MSRSAIKSEFLGNSASFPLRARPQGNCVARILKLKREWELGDQIGQGGFGKVYTAKSSAHEQAVVKLIPKSKGADRELLFVDTTPFRNVVPIIDSGETEDSWAIVMPRAEQSLRQYLEGFAGPLELGAT